MRRYKKIVKKAYIIFDKLNNDRVLTRMDAVSTSVFAALNVGVAGGKAIKLNMIGYQIHLSKITHT